MSRSSRDEGRYSRVSRRVWNDAKFQRLSAPKPNAQTLLFRLLSGPELGCIPGLFSMREGGMAEALGWPLKAFRRCFAEVIGEGIAIFDARAGLCWLPRAIEHNEPANPNVIKSWALAWTELPECDLKEQAGARLLEWAAAKGEAWEDAMRKAFGKPSRSERPKVPRKAFPKPSGKQEQEQEQDQEILESHPKDLPGQDREPPPPRALSGAGSATKVREQARAHMVRLERSFQRRPTQLAEDFEPSEQARDLATRLGLDLAEELEAMRLHARSHGSVSCDWDADLQRWLRRGADFRRRQAQRDRERAERYGTPPGREEHEDRKQRDAAAPLDALLALPGYEALAGGGER